MKLKDSGYIPQFGDLVFFGQEGGQHVGIVLDYNVKTGIISTIEGNTSIKNSRDGVAYKEHDINSTTFPVHGFGQNSGF